MVYHTVGLGPSNAQMAALAEGDKIHLPAKNIPGDIPFKLTTAQLTKLKKAHESGKGCLLKLSPSQAKMMAQSGSGRFTDMLRAGFKSGVAAAKPLARKALQSGLDYGAKAIGQKISDAAGLEQQGEGFFGDIVRGVGHLGVDALAGLAGGQIKPKPKRVYAKRPVQGKGFFGDIVRGVGHFGVDALAGMAGGEVNPRRTPNEGLRAALFEKKVGSGLTY